MKRTNFVLLLAIGLVYTVYLLYIIIQLREHSIKLGYKQGQIDALNGKWKYEQVVQPDTLYINKPE
jgi:hypothetical protein